MGEVRMSTTGGGAIDAADTVIGSWLLEIPTSTARSTDSGLAGPSMTTRPFRSTSTVSHRREISAIRCEM